MLPQTMSKSDNGANSDEQSRPLGRLAQNLSETLKYLGENVETIEEAGKKWFAGVKERHFNMRDNFPTRSTLENWCEGNKKGYNPQRLFVLCAYLRFGRYELSLPTNFENICMVMADRMVNAPSAWDFRRDYALPRPRRPNRFVKNTADISPPTEAEISKLVESAILAVKAAQAVVIRNLDLLKRTPAKVELEFQPFLTGQGQHTTRMDTEAEDAAHEVFLSRHGDDIHFVGEERLKKHAGQFAGWRRRFCVLADMVDGTDLAAMDTDLWCSAIALYDNVRSRILGTVVGFPSGRVCVAREDRMGAWFTTDEKGVLPEDDKSNELEGPSGLTDIFRARIGFYGQKPLNFLKAASDPSFMALLQKVNNVADSEPTLRLFNFAGNPMIVKLVDRSKAVDEHPIADGIDAVFEKRGQRPHDFVPSAYIALMMGAAMFDLNEMPITKEDLAEMVRYPNTRAKGYVIAASENLAVFLAQNLSHDAEAAG